MFNSSQNELIKLLREILMHQNSLEFELAERIWNSSTDKKTKEKAISYYEMACDKSDARAYMALYEIKKIANTSSGSELDTENSSEVEDLLKVLEDYGKISSDVKNHEAIFYIQKASELGYLPALLYAGTLDQTYSVYSRLIFLSIGLALSFKEKSDLYSEFQRSFLDLSEKFASEFIPDILRIGQEWKTGETIDIKNSSLNKKLISNPNNYDPKKDPTKSYLQIFPRKHDIEQYLRQLPGAEEYYIAVKIEEENPTLFREKMEAAANKGNGQAIYALSQDGIIK